MPTPPPNNAGHFAADDSAQMLKLLELEIINRRAKRLARGDDQRQMVRMAGVLMFFLLMLVVVGAMWYMQNSRMESRLPHHPQVTKSPVP
jgi:hypothetical protein